MTAKGTVFLTIEDETGPINVIVWPAMVERYRRVDFGRMELSLTFDDPGTFVKPFHATVRFDLAPQEELMEYVCENNKPQHMVGK